MKLLLFITSIISLIVFSCKPPKVCEDKTAVNYQYEEECKYCSLEVEKEFRTIQIIDPNPTSLFYNQNVADVEFIKYIYTQKGTGCLERYSQEKIENPYHFIEYTLKNKTNKKMNIGFSIEYKNNGSYKFQKYPKQFINSQQSLSDRQFSKDIYTNLKDATINFVIIDTIGYQ